jgi:O-antigen/teichoic acid export membrane protein
VLWNYQTARGRLYWRQSIASTVLNLAAVLALVPFLGPVGAGLASTISYTAIGIFVVWRFCKDTGSRPSDVLVPTAQDVQVILRTLRRLATGDTTID